jgi:hypothetical protein
MTDGNGGKDYLMCGIAPGDNDHIVRLPESRRELVWWPSGFASARAGATLKANESIICWMEPVEVKTKMRATTKRLLEHAIFGNENQQKIGQNHESTRFRVVFTN